MRKFLTLLFIYVGKFLLSLRYRIEIRGEEQLKKEMYTKSGGVLFLPNHVAQIDPLFVITRLWLRFKMRPLAVEYIKRLGFFRFITELFGGIFIPDFETSINELKLKKAEKVLDEVVSGLKKKDAFLLYPSGRLKHTAKEILGGASATHQILQRAPNTNIILIRSTGLWGSIFSRAIEKKSPNIPKATKQAFFILLKNFFFFCRRRKVIFEIETNPKDFPYNGTRLEVNRYLENWYNRYSTKEGVKDEEPLELVSYSCFHEEFPKILEKGEKNKNRKGKVHIAEHEREVILDEIARIANREKKGINEEMSLAIDLGLDSLEVAGLVAFLADRYEIGEISGADIETVRDIFELASGEKIVESRSDDIPFTGWPKEAKRLPPEGPFGSTIMEAFLRNCDRMGPLHACADDLMGPMSYSKLKKAALVLAIHFKKLPSKHIGVMLPSSTIANIVILAIMLADKVPVMLNWTLGSKFLNDTVEQTDAKVVISSWKFLERLSHVEFGKLMDKIHLLEDIKKKIPLSRKLRGLFLSYCSCWFTLTFLGLSKKSEHADAVILFTSGTEAIPKGVPLSHRNVLSCQYAAMQCLSLHEKDVLFGILPPFHSFGFTVTGLLPLLAGLKVAFYPDPTDSFGLAKGLSRWGITIFCSAPSFLKGLLSAASKKDLKRVRLFVSGAEKAPEELYQKIGELGKGHHLIEGYGITECSPVLSLNRINLPAVGVGQLLPGVEACTIHVDSKELMPRHEEGEICVRGPNVFNGYLGDVPSPFIELEGKKWYRTGDLGYLDKHGNLILSGRLKRFTKIGGEMVSLGGVEAAIVKAYPTDEEGPGFALCIDERDEERPLLVLFATREIEKQEINDHLKKVGFSRLIKISDVRKVDEIPLMGTGKTDYRTLQSWIKK